MSAQSTWSAGNTVMFEHLVAHGYVVAAIDHPYFTGQTRLPDGSIAPNDMSSPVGYPVVREDFLFVLDQLTAVNGAGGALQGRLDLDRVGMFGHSAGGSTAADMVLNDARVKAAINYDGPYSLIEIGSMPQPLLTVHLAGAYLPEQDTWTDAFAADAVAAADPAHWAIIDKIIHQNLQLVRLYVAEAAGTPVSELTAETLTAICNQLNLAFFDTYLGDGSVESIADVADAFPDVTTGEL